MSLRAPEFSDRAQVVVRATSCSSAICPVGESLKRLERDDAVTHALRFEREHPAELAAAEDADRV